VEKRRIGSAVGRCDVIQELLDRDDIGVLVPGLLAIADGLLDRSVA
jgi:hypothetical protein